MFLTRPVAARQAHWKLALAAVAAAGVAAALHAPAWIGGDLPGPGAATDTVALSTLPVQAQQTQRLILSGGPFPYDKDGSVFGNRERLLPAQTRGYYREYTVTTPGAPDRGARRIVCGGVRPTLPDACYYTADHYASFRLIVQ